MGSKYATAARLAWRQHGRVSPKQLVEAGIGRHEIQRWLENGRLVRVHIGVYALGHTAPSTLADYMAAVLAGGDDAALSHFADAHILHLLPGGPPPPEITVPTTAHRRRPGMVIHRVRELPERDTSTLHGIPILTAPRTLLDLAPRLTLARLGRACHEAWVRHHTTPHDFEACIARNPHKPGIAKLRRALAADVTLSDLEADFVALVRAHDLPLPRTNIDHRNDTVDCHWPELDLTIELLSFRFHATRHAFEQDVARRRRSNHIAFSWGDVYERGERTIAELAAAIAARQHAATG